MIRLGNKELDAVYLGKRAIAAIYAGGRLVWEAVRNCIAAGRWQHGHGWQHGTGWAQKRKNNS